jgi:hypothetical protein
MTTTNKNHRRTLFRFALLGVIGALVLPSVGNASTASNETSPTAVGECPPPKNTIVLEIDVATGDAYVVDETGGLTQIVDNELDVYVGTLSSVLVDLQYSSGDYAVEISASGGSTTTRNTRGGALRYWMNTAYSEYVFDATSLAVMMTPVEPVIVIRPSKDCPPTP